MENRKVLRDLTVDNIITSLENAHKLDISPTIKPRMSIMKAFDPLYESPYKTTGIRLNQSWKRTPETSINTKTFASINCENYAPMSEELLDLLDAQHDIHVKGFIEDIILDVLDTALDIAVPDNSLYEDEFQSAIAVDEGIMEELTIYETDSRENLHTNSETDESNFISQRIFLENPKTKLPKDSELDSKLTCWSQHNFELHLEREEQERCMELFRSDDTLKQEQFEAMITSMSETISELTTKCKQQNEYINKMQHDYAEKENELTTNLSSCSEYMHALEVQCRNQYEYIEKLKSENTQKEAALSQNVLDLQILYKKQEVYITLLKSEVVTKENEFEARIASLIQLVDNQAVEIKTLKTENVLANKHLSNLEISFGDLHQKYKRSKGVIEGYIANEFKLKHTLEMLEPTLKRYDYELEVIKQKASDHVNRLGKELQAAREEYKSDLDKLLEKIRSLELKESSAKSRRRNTEKRIF